MTETIVENKDVKTSPLINKTVEITATPLKYKILSDETIEFSQAKATEFLDLKTFSGERDVIDSWVQHLFDEYKRGRFLWHEVHMATARVAGEPDVYHINGQHTAWLRLNMPTNANCKVRYVQYEVPDEDSLRTLYGVFDRNKTRSPGHVIKALLAGNEEIDGVWSSAIRNLSTGLRMWLFGDNLDAYRRNGPNEIAELITSTHSKLFRTVAKLWQDNYRVMHIRRVAVIAAMMATFDKSATAAVEFWQPVIDGLNLNTANDARHRLREFLTSIRLDESSAGRGKRIVNSEDVYRVCISAWNCWREGREQKMTFRAPDRRYRPK